MCHGPYLRALTTHKSHREVRFGMATCIKCRPPKKCHDLKGAAPRRDRRTRETTWYIPVCLCSYRVRRLLVLCFCPTSLSGAKATLREARRCGQSSVARRRCAERNELLYPSRCNGVAVGAVGGTLRSLVLQRNEARALREHWDGLQLLWRVGFDEVETSLLECVFQGSFQRFTDLCIVGVVNRDIESNDRWLHRLEVRGACNVDVTRQACGVCRWK